MVRRDDGSLMVELVVGMAILSLAMVPLAYSFAKEQAITRNAFNRAVTMEAIDGEMEILMAGEWRTAPAGTQPYALPEELAKTLPPGKATLTVTGKHVRLDWRPDKKYSGGEIVREADVP
jgi:hypothetical protein